MLNTNKEKDAMIEVLLNEIKNISALSNDWIMKIEYCSIALLLDKTFFLNLQLV